MEGPPAASGTPDAATAAIAVRVAPTMRLCMAHAALSSQPCAAAGGQASAREVATMRACSALQSPPALSPAPRGRAERQTRTGSPARRPPQCGRPRDAQRAAQWVVGGGGGAPQVLGEEVCAPLLLRAALQLQPVRAALLRARAALAGQPGHCCRAAAPSADPARSACPAGVPASTTKLLVRVCAGARPRQARLRRLEDGVHSHMAALAHAAVQQPTALDGEVERAGHVGLERVGRVPLKRHRRAVRRLLPARCARLRDYRGQTKARSAGMAPALELCYLPCARGCLHLHVQAGMQHLCQPAHACRQTWFATPALWRRSQSFPTVLCAVCQAWGASSRCIQAVPFSQQACCARPHRSIRVCFAMSSSTVIFAPA